MSCTDALLHEYCHLTICKLAFKNKVLVIDVWSQPGLKCNMVSESIINLHVPVLGLLFLKVLIKVLSD